MTTFDLDEVRTFAASLDARIHRCDNGEGTECSTLDLALAHYASLCCEYAEQVRRWGQAIFAGRVVFDPEVEKVLQDEGRRLLARATSMCQHGKTAEVPCYQLDGLTFLTAALYDLSQLLDGWVTPKLAVGPSARQGLPLDALAAAESRRRIEALAPLPADWQPGDPQQRALYRMTKRS